MPQLRIEFVGFVIVVTAIYWLTKAAYRKWVITLASAAFMIALDAVSFLLLTSLSILVFRSAESEHSNEKSISILILLFLLFCGVRFAQLFRRSETLTHLFLLLGFGFYMLKLAHYWIERKNKTFREHTFWDFYNYMLFYPTMTIGPIMRFEDFLREFRRNRWDDGLFAKGLERILYGYVKILVVANWFVAVSFVKAALRIAPAPSALSTFLDSVIYGLHLYFTFSGASDIAIGLGALLGYRVCENFQWPFLKRNIGEFWQSWHMSLSAWCRQYIFTPIFSRSRNLPVAFLASMITLGLWHEFSLRYLLWGCYHGTGLFAWRWYQRNLKPRLPQISHPVWKTASAIFCIILTFVFVAVGFTIPRSQSFAEIVKNFQILFGV